ncbi:MAG TPA: hypothetical protein VK473_04655 [Terriglobales bacterium]|nr:hypothetical protein [Terriglobales bacterium]
MTTFKKAVVIGSFSIGALLLLKGKRTAGLMVATAGVALLAAEFPKGFAVVSVFMPPYISRAAKLYSTVSRMADEYRQDNTPVGGHPLQYNPDFTD